MGLLRRLVAILRRAGPHATIGWPRHDVSGQGLDDWYGSSLGERKTQPWSPTIILEGVTCTRHETIGRITYAVWVEAPASLRLARGLARDSTFAGKEELWSRRMIEEDEFFCVRRNP
jgi:hypothetical protein